MEAACRVIETEFGVSLHTAISGTKYHCNEKAVKNRLRYFKQRLKTRTRPFSLFGHQTHTHLDRASNKCEHYGIGGVIYWNFGLFTANVEYPDQPDVVHERIFASLGDALGAHSSQYLPCSVAARLRAAHFYTFIGDKVLFNELPDKTPEEAQLPLICDSHYDGLEHPLQPLHFGWLNYWSPDVCKYVGFPERLRGHTVLKHCYTTPRGAWIVKLGHEPFESSNPMQMELLREMYDLFPLVGVRMKHCTSNTK